MNSRDNRENRREDGGDWIEDICVILSRGDITKREAIIWGYTIAECEPYLRYCIRDVTFREAVLAFFEVKDNPPLHSSQEGNAHAIRNPKSVGEYCKGGDIAECRKYWGEQVLARVCATCRN